MDFFNSHNILHKTADIDGIPLHHFERRGSPIFIKTYIRAGARYDTKEGTAHFLEHMLVAGTHRFPTKDILAEYIEDVGGSFVFTTNLDFIMIDIQVPEAGDLEVAMTVLNEVMSETLFNPIMFESERGAINSEYINRKSTQKTWVWDTFRHLVFRGTVLDRSILGDNQPLTDISLQDLIDFKNKFFTRENISIITTGDINIETLTPAIKKALEPIKNEEINTRAGIVKDAAIAIPEKEYFKLDIYKSKQASLVAGFRLHSFTLLDVACVAICAQYLAVGRASFLVKKLRYEKGLIYDITAFGDVYKDRGLLQIKTDCEATLFSEVINTIRECLAKFIKNGIPSDKLAHIKTKLLKSFKIKLQTSGNFIEWSGNFAKLSEYKTIGDYVAVLGSISEKDIRNYIDQNISLECMYLAVCGDESLKNFKFHE
ncbi:MAG: pitrilysin family protein [Candidatus Pacebacteria bacterium]|nr:pitrilysin family protein [Candidatus Paceibacterota bacterium]